MWFRRLGVVVLTVSTFGCDRIKPQPPPEPPRTWDVNAVSLHRSYLDGSDRWTGQRVRVSLNAKNYTIVPEGIVWHADRTSEPPSILFRCNPPHDNLTALTCTGKVIGRLDDGQRRASGATWAVVVVECTVEQR